MNSQEAREILESLPPGASAASDARVAEALRQAERDPALGRWLAGLRAFDQSMRVAVAGIPVPADLKASLLASPQIVRIPLWRDWRARAAAAAVVLLAGLGALVLQRAPLRFAEFRNELIAHDWAGDPHLDFESRDLPQVQRWLSSHGASGDFALPAVLSEWHLHGCRIVERDHEKVSLLCLGNGVKHLHLFVLNRADFPDLPPTDAPDFEKCGGWKRKEKFHGKSILQPGFLFRLN